MFVYLASISVSSSVNFILASSSSRRTSKKKFYCLKDKIAVLALKNPTQKTKTWKHPPDTGFLYFTLLNT